MTMNNEFLGDMDWLDDTNDEDLMLTLPPIAQWRRGDLTHPHPVLSNGGIQLPLDEFMGFAPASWEPVKCIHGGGVVVESFLLEQIHLAVLGYTKTWYIMDGDNKRFLDDYQDGAKSQVRVYALCKELEGQPMILSASGLNAKALDTLVRFDLPKRIITPAARLAKRRFAKYHFWLPITAGAKQTVTNNQYITPPTLAYEELDTDILRSLFVGREIAEAAGAEMDNVKAWMERASKPMTRPVAAPGAEALGGYAPAGAVAEEDQIPF